MEICALHRKNIPGEPHLAKRKGERPMQLHHRHALYFAPTVVSRRLKLQALEGELGAEPNQVQGR